VNVPQRRKTRSEQRQDTEDRILHAARRIFSEAGYDRATIRAIAAAARTDPGLVMRYFGSKEELFARAVPMPLDDPPTDGPDDLAERLLALLDAKLESEPVELLAMLRSMTAHPEAAREMRAAQTQQQRRVVDAIGGPDGVLRAGLLGAISIGVVVGRNLLQLDGLRDASAQEIRDLLRPCFQSLVGGASQAPIDDRGEA
jgi:AcrR family transcriptional regulator